MSTHLTVVASHSLLVCADPVVWVVNEREVHIPAPTRRTVERNNCWHSSSGARSVDVVRIDDEDSYNYAIAACYGHTNTADKDDGVIGMTRTQLHLVSTIAD